jgi:hypothetical protein
LKLYAIYNGRAIAPNYPLLEWAMSSSPNEPEQGIGKAPGRALLSNWAAASSVLLALAIGWLFAGVAARFSGRWGWVLGIFCLIVAWFFMLLGAVMGALGVRRAGITARGPRMALALNSFGCILGFTLMALFAGARDIIEGEHWPLVFFLCGGLAAVSAEWISLGGVFPLHSATSASVTAVIGFLTAMVSSVLVPWGANQDEIWYQLDAVIIRSLVSAGMVAWTAGALAGLLAVCGLAAPALAVDSRRSTDAIAFGAGSGFSLLAAPESWYRPVFSWCPFALLLLSVSLVGLIALQWGLKNAKHPTQMSPSFSAPLLAVLFLLGMTGVLVSSSIWYAGMTSELLVAGTEQQALPDTCLACLAGWCALLCSWVMLRQKRRRLTLTLLVLSLASLIVSILALLFVGLARGILY